MKTITTQQKICLLELLDAFLEVCNKYNLTYYMAYGSCLGAIRHKGFIPWDDDLDVYMPRNDFEKLLNLPDNIFGENIRLSTIYNTKNYSYDFPKLELKNTTIIERLYPSYIGGVFLDIFPLDAVPSNEQNRKIQFEKLNKIVDRYVNLYIKHDNDCYNIFDLLSVKIKRLFSKNNMNFIKKWESLVRKHPKEGDNVIDYHNYWSRGPVPYEYFDKGVKVEFEGRDVIVPSNYDKYLKHMYGDYMKLPPLEKRYAHKFDYVNYEKRISDIETKLILEEISNKYKYRFTIKRELKNILKLFQKKCLNKN